MNTTLFWCLGQLSSFAGLVPLSFSLFKGRHFNPVQKRLLSLITLIFITEMVVNIVWLNSKNNNPIFHFYVVLEFYFMLRIFKLVLVPQLTNVQLNIIFFAFAGFAILNTCYVQNLFTFNSNATALSAFLMIVLALVYFYSLLKKGDYQRLDKTPMFWISAGMLIYFSTNLLLFFISKNEAFAARNGATIWGVHAIVNIVLMTFYTLALWIQPKAE